MTETKMATAPNQTRDEALAYSVADSAKRTNLSRAEMYNRINAGDIPAKKLGRRTIILHQDLQDYLSRLPAYTRPVAG
jgi:predicted DNA-binding transcriptional regulator AlpA